MDKLTKIKVDGIPEGFQELNFINNGVTLNYVVARRALVLPDDTYAVRQCGEQSPRDRRLLRGKSARNDIILFAPPPPPQ
jgi:hypothetical protein